MQLAASKTWEDGQLKTVMLHSVDCMLTYYVCHLIRKALLYACSCYHTVCITVANTVTLVHYAIGCSDCLASMLI